MGKKVSELEGAELDYWVAMAEGFEVRYNSDDSGVIITGYWNGDRSLAYSHDRAYSSRWNEGGPIIERERITVQASQSGDWRAFVGDGTTTFGTGLPGLVQARGDTALIAAMRAYVASKYGEEVPK